MSKYQLPLPLEHRPSLAGEDFLLAACNEAAVAWLERWPDWPTRALVLHGPPGCGKTHLAHSFLDRCGGTIIDHRALATGEAIDLADRSAVCIIDDADQAVTAGSEKPLLHLYNILVERRGYLLLTAKAPPARWPIRLADLRSRLTTATPVGVDPPDDALIAGVLVKLFMDRGLSVANEVILYALPRMERSFAAARKLVADLDLAALGSRRKITVALLREVLESAGEAA
jgi:chromosomal replication initiation ATPase DnaA